jgi:hypothetical protein
MSTFFFIAFLSFFINHEKEEIICGNFISFVLNYFFNFLIFINNFCGVTHDCHERDLNHVDLYDLCHVSDLTLFL